VLHLAAGRVGAMDVGAVTEGGIAAALDGAGVVYNLGADEIDVPAGPFVIYHGSHGDRGAHRADVVLPGAAYPEQNAIFVNTEGRPQMAFRAGFPPGEAREDWAILRALSERVGARLPYDSQSALRAALFAAHPHLAQIDAVPANAAPASLPAAGEPTAARYASPVRDHYLTNPIARASSVMAELSRLAADRAATRPLAAE
ncbi:MAG: molybdopterin-dependent oxidoreductase, partial [Rubrimonas sp.]